MCLNPRYRRPLSKVVFHSRLCSMILWSVAIWSLVDRSCQKPACSSRSTCFFSTSARSWPPSVNIISPLIIQVIHFSRKQSMNGLFKQTSRGWTRLVRPPGITAVAVLFSWSCCFTVSVRWALNESQTSKLWVFTNQACLPDLLDPNFNPTFVHPSLRVIINVPLRQQGIA